MEQIPHSSMDVPATYRTCVTGRIKSSWAQSLWGMTSSSVQEADKQEHTVLAVLQQDEVIDRIGSDHIHDDIAAAAKLHASKYSVNVGDSNGSNGKG